MFEINDKVCALNDDFEGIVVAIEDSEFLVEDADGFVLKFYKSELIPAIDDALSRQLSYVPPSVFAQKKITKTSKTERVKPKERNKPAMEVDLHIHKLTKQDRGMSNYEILNVQMDTAQRRLDFAIQKRIQKIVFIHGVGQGVLREELYTLFRRYDNVKYYDADFQKYGVGATEVYIFQN